MKKGTYGALLPDSLAGVGLKPQHYSFIRDNKPPVGWFEIHPENYFGGGLNLKAVAEIRHHYPISLHAVGLSLGSAHAVDQAHIDQIRELVDLLEPFHVSDHASWSSSGNAHLNDLLPLPYTQESLDTLCRNVDQVQEALGRPILVENPSTYIEFAFSEMEEPEFLNQLARNCGCSLLLDLNNIYVQAHNHGFDPFDYVDRIDARVGEFHLAGPSEHALPGGATLLIDTHSAPVRKTVWDLYKRAVNRFGCIPTLIEWDNEVPAFDLLQREANKADLILKGKRELTA